MKESNRKSERLMSIGEASALLGVSPLTMRYWIQHRKIESHKLGGRRLVSESEIQRLIAVSRIPARRELEIA